MLKDQELIVGLTVGQACLPWIAKLYADAGADFIYIEGEHASINAGDLANFVLASRLSGLPVVSKSPYLDRGWIAKLLDAGVTGIQLPWTETAQEAAELVRFIKFPPLGIRAAAPGMGNTDYEPVDSAAWVKQANEETLVLAHIETKTGVANIDDILAVPGVDVMFVGLFDLSISLGCPGEFDHPDVAGAVARLIEAAVAHGKVPGMWAPSYETAKPWIKKGVRFLETGSDIGFISKSACNLMSQFPGYGSRLSSGQSHA